ncbi:hypothetical protein [Microseira wollei]|uniref:Uncharacterized protein n=1 Tax=Microseira wollei NIES-4236 TaxID=2530354 RepID=A0AAV3XKN9_9CYAN|nr:hypothetical protein [Microseira wollei]GET43502.1 hypothetical protein MiSe_83270 [Microseira wollei NIES-4236]
MEPVHRVSASAFGGDNYPPGLRKDREADWQIPQAVPGRCRRCSDLPTEKLFCGSRKTNPQTSECLLQLGNEEAVDPRERFQSASQGN